MLKNNAFDLMQIMADLRNKVSGCEQKHQTLDHLWGKLSVQEKELNAIIENNDVKKRKLMEMFRQVQGETEGLKNKIALLDKEIRQKECDEAGFIERELKERERLQTLKARLNLLTEMQHDYEGYYPGVRAILQAARKKHLETAGIVGVIAELIEVPDRVRLAIETALGGGIQSIVTETDADGKKPLSI